MIDLTVLSDNTVAMHDESGTVVINNAHALSIICLNCGGMKNVYLHHEPTQEEMAGRLRTGIEAYAMFAQCKCGESE